MGKKYFNTSADCKPELHYMANIEERLSEIRAMVVRGDYFTINKARQYGKTTLLKALARNLEQDHIVISLDFQKLSHTDFGTEDSFVKALSREILKKAGLRQQMPAEILNRFTEYVENTGIKEKLADLFLLFSEWCHASAKPVVLMIDEVDSASNNQIFLDFLAQIRGYYIDRDETPTFQSVILAGVYDVKNLKMKFGTGNGYKMNSPWNIAADFLVDMSFSAEDIAGMLTEYDKDYNVGMDIPMVSRLIYDYTSGYPFLVSRICKLVDERVAGSKCEAYTRKNAWGKEGILEAVRLLLSENNTLFESLFNKLEDYPELKEMLRSLLFKGKEIIYAVGIQSIDMAFMLGFVQRKDNTIVIANRIFETLLYNYFLALPEMQQEAAYDAALREKEMFIKDGHLDMKLILERFVVHFDALYGDRQQSFLEEDGRRFFLLYLKPIINGTGNYYIESQTRNQERTDVIVDYLGEQFVIEMKIWRGNAYLERGEKQLSDYLDHYQLNKGYMLSFCFNKKKKIGIREITFGNKILIEAIV